jgi:hypothetical protein
VWPGDAVADRLDDAREVMTHRAGSADRCRLEVFEPHAFRPALLVTLDPLHRRRPFIASA